MQACPSSDELQNFLDEGLSADYVARILAHIEECYLCQQALERLTFGNTDLRDAIAQKIADTDIDATADLPQTEASIVRQELSLETADTGAASAAETKDGPGSADEPQTCPSATTDSESMNPPSRSTEVAPGEPGHTSDFAHTDDTGPQAHAQNRNTSDWPSIPGYEILGVLGEGGMGVVYKARHLGLNRLVALKMIRGGSQARPDHLVRFSSRGRGGRAAAAPQHPSDLRHRRRRTASRLSCSSCSTAGTSSDRLAGTPQPGKQAAELVMTLARAIHVAHQAGIIHRDSKPPTSCTPPTACPRSPTSAWPSGSTRTPATP